MVLFNVAAALAGVHRVTAQTGVSPPSMETNMPSDIDPQSGFRLPLPRREDLDEAGRGAYDRAVTPGRTIAGLQGPAGVARGIADGRQAHVDEGGDAGRHSLVAFASATASASEFGANPRPTGPPGRAKRAK